MKLRLVMITLLLVVLLGSIAHGRAVEVNVATIVAAGGSEEVALNLFKERVESRSNGELQVNLFLGAILGDERTVFEQLAIGETHISLGGEIVVTTYAPELYIFGIPFLFSKDAVRNILNEGLGDRIRETVLERANIEVLGFSLRGARQLMTVNKKILEPEDVVGLKLRLPPIESWIIAWEELGAIPTPVAPAEQFTALQMGMVEATENPLSPLYALRFHELCKYVHLTDHLYSFRGWSMSKRWHDRLSPEHQKIVYESAQEAIEYLTSIEEDFERNLLIEMQKSGTQVVVPNNTAFMQAVLPAVDAIKKDWAPGLFEEYVLPLIEN